MGHVSNKKRLEDLRSLGILGTGPEKRYDDITDLAALICHAPIALISLVDQDRLFFKSHHGLNITQTKVENSFCARTIEFSQEPIIVKDARKDEVFKEYSLVKGKPNCVFYAGVALVSNSGNALGALCILDKEPRELGQDQIDGLTALARQVVRLFELRKFSLEAEDMKTNLLAESQRLKNIINATQVGTWEWHIPSGKVIVNERWAEMLGYTLEELVPLTIDRVFEMIHPTDSITIEKKTTACMEKKSEFYVGDFRFYHKDGPIVWIHDRGQVVSWDPLGKPLVMTGTHTDITEKKNKEAQFESIANNIPGAVFRYTFHRDGKDELQLVSDGAMTLWGYSAKEVMSNNRLIWDRYEKEDLKAHFESMHKAAEDLSFRNHEWRYHHPDGNLRWHRASGNPIGDNGSTTWDSVVLDVTEEKRNELEVEKSEKRFKSLVQNGSDLICILDAEANYLYVSPTSTNILGTPPEEYIGKSALDYIHPGDKPLVFESLSKLENEKQDGLTIIRFRHRDGSWRWLETVVTNLMDDPTVGGLVANSRDVTERILTEEKLKRSEAYYRGLSESQTNYVIRIDLEGNYNYVNKKFAEEFGWLYPDGKMYGQNLLESIMVYHHEKTQDMMAKCIAQPEEVIKIEIDKPTPDGTVMTTLWNLMCLADAEGNPSEMQCIGLDITDRIKSEKELKESEHRYSELFQLSPQPMWVYEIETMKFLDVNKAAIHRYGYSFDEFMDMTLRDIRHESEISKLEAAVEEVRALKKNFSKGTYLHKNKDGELIVVEIKSNILFYKGKKAEVVLATDITERQKHLTAIEEQNKKLREIAWAQSHLVRAPLTNILGLINLLKAFPISSGEGDVYLRLLIESSQKLDDAIKNIVKTSQFDPDSTQE